LSFSCFYRFVTHDVYHGYGSLKRYDGYDGKLLRCWWCWLGDDDLEGGDDDLEREDADLEEE